MSWEFLRANYFIEAHLHYTLIGGMLFPMLAGVAYYFPFVTGRHCRVEWGSGRSDSRSSGSTRPSCQCT
jgi:heme/copper-type cytochrome/quinol oxidase subunit 1